MYSKIFATNEISAWKFLTNEIPTQNFFNQSAIDKKWPVTFLYENGSLYYKILRIIL